MGDIVLCINDVHILSNDVDTSRSILLGHCCFISLEYLTVQA